MTAVRRLLTTFLLSLTAATMLAQDAPQRTTERVTAETDQDLANARALRLSLSDAVNTAVRQNLGVQVQTYENQIAAQNYRGEYGLFDFISAANAATSSNRSPAASQFLASGSRSTELNASINQIIPTGGQYSIGLNNSRSSSTGGGFTVNPRYNTSLTFGFNQPLMRDFGVDVTRRGITIARNTLGINQGAFRNTLMDTVHLVEQAYLDLIYARRNVEVVKESLFLARDQARITQIRIDVGAAAPLDILQPRVQVATTEESLVTAVASVRDAEDRLRALLNLPQEEWDRPIIPTEDSIVDYQAMTVDAAAAVQQALANRPEIGQQALTTDIRKVQAMYLRNQVLPTVDFELGYNLGGLAGRALELDQDGEPTGRILSTGFGNALGDIFSRDFPGWNVGVNFGLPLYNINARAAARAAQLDLDQSRTLESQTRQTIAVEVRGTVRAIDEFSRTIAASRAARDAAERNVDAARRRYENGMATNFEVLQVQQQLADARVRELLALVGYRKAVAAYHRAIGDILDVHRIQVDDKTQIEVPPDTFFDRVNWLNYGSRIRSEE